MVAQAPASASPTPNQRSIATTYIAQFAPRTDAYSAWNGHIWVAVREPLTPEVVLNAFRTKRPVSAYFPDHEGMTHLAAIDFDTDEGVQQAHRVARRLRAEGAETIVEHSRRGAHLWWPFAERLHASLALRALRAATHIVGLPPDPKIEFRPETGAAPGPDGVGKCLRMLMMPHPALGKSFPVYDADGKPMPNLMASFLLSMPDPTPRETVEKIARLGPKPSASMVAGTELAPVRSYSREQSGPLVSDVVRERWGHILKVGKANRCFAHDDRHPSLSVLPDDRRLLCKSPECLLHNGGRGYSARDLLTLEL